MVFDFDPSGQRVPKSLNVTHMDALGDWHVKATDPMACGLFQREEPSGVGTRTRRKSSTHTRKRKASFAAGRRGGGHPAATTSARPSSGDSRRARGDARATNAPVSRRCGDTRAHRTAWRSDLRAGRARAVGGCAVRSAAGSERRRRKEQRQRRRMRAARETPRARARRRAADAAAARPAGPGGVPAQADVARSGGGRGRHDAASVRAETKRRATRARSPITCVFVKCIASTSFNLSLSVNLLFVPNARVSGCIRQIWARMARAWSARAARLLVALALVTSAGGVREPRAGSRLAAPLGPRFARGPLAPDPLAAVRSDGTTRARAEAPSALGLAYSSEESARFVLLAGAAYCDAGLESWTCPYCNGTDLVDVRVTRGQRNVRGYVGWDARAERAVVAFRGTEPSRWRTGWRTWTRTTASGSFSRSRARWSPPPARARARRVPGLVARAPGRHVRRAGGHRRDALRGGALKKKRGERKRALARRRHRPLARGARSRRPPRSSSPPRGTTRRKRENRRDKRRD